MQRLRFLLNYSPRLGSSWSTTQVSLTTPSDVEQQMDIERHPPPNSTCTLGIIIPQRKMKQRPPASCGSSRCLSIRGISWSQHPASPRGARLPPQPPDATRFTIHRNVRKRTDSGRSPQMRDPANVARQGHKATTAQRHGKI